MWDVGYDDFFFKKKVLRLKSALGNPLVYIK